MAEQLNAQRGRQEPGTDRSPREVVAALYAAFAARDGAAMGALYHPDATFSDPVFGCLRGAEIGAMWSMLCEAAPDLQVRASNIAPDGSSAHWDADYSFPLTHLHVHNSVDASFVIEGGKIRQHTDSFDFYRWTSQALGVVGWLFGWSDLFHAKMTDASRAQLAEWQAQHPNGAATTPGK